LKSSPKKKEEKSLKEGVKMILANKLLLKTIMSFSLNSFANGGLLSSMVLYLNLPVSHLRTRMGVCLACFFVLFTRFWM
jgi:hypothetical protein